MDAERVRGLMQQLATGVGQRGVSLRCDCENLETVYLVVEQDGSIRVTDDHRTFQYLERGVDSTYVPIERLSVEAARQVCHELGVELKPASSEGYPSIECVPKPGEPVSAAVQRVAEAIDRVFNLAQSANTK